MESDKLRSTSQSTYNYIIGTDEKIDLSGYATIHIKAKGIAATAGTCGCFFYNTSAKSLDTASTGTFEQITTLDSVVDYTLDISTISSAYIGLETSFLRACEVYEIYLVPKQPKYIIKDGEYTSGSMSWDYNIAGNTGTSNPVSIVNKDGYIEIKKNFGYLWADSRASAYVENIGISIANGDTIHMRAKISITANFGSGGNFRIGSVNTKSTSRTYYGIADLNAAETITDFAYKNTLNNPPVIVLPEFNKATTASGISGTITIEVYDLYVI